MQEYKVRQTILSFAKNYGIFDNLTGEEIGMVHGHFFAITPNFEYKLRHNNQLIFRIQGSFFRTNFNIIDQHNNLLANIHIPFWQFCEKEIHLYIQGVEYYTRGNIYSLNFDVLSPEGDHVVATVDKKFFSFRDTFMVRIYEGLDYRIGLALAVVIDARFHSDR